MGRAEDAAAVYGALSETGFRGARGFELVQVEGMPSPEAEAQGKQLQEPQLFDFGLHWEGQARVLLRRDCN